MKITDFYKVVYSLLENVTPLDCDCGKLCNKRCCEDSDEGEGMYLYPGEEIMLRECDSFGKITECDFKVGGKSVGFFTCDGHCERDLRPLACRIFPLVPYISAEGELFIMFDARGAEMCPLAKTGVTDEFRNAVRRVANMLVKNSDTREFLYEQSRLIDDYIEIKNHMTK